MIKVKICGLSTKDAVDVSIEYGASFLGFVFHRGSPRDIAAEEAQDLVRNIDKATGIKTVAVVVDPTEKFLEKLLYGNLFDFIQLHGNESFDQCQLIKGKYKIGIIKAFNIAGRHDLQHVNNYKEVADYYLFDGKISGGGKPFDWSLTKGELFMKDFFIAGGVNIDNLIEAVSVTDCKFVDISSGVESIKGIKDIEKIRKVLTLAKML